MNKTILFTAALSMIILFGCEEGKDNSNKIDIAGNQIISLNDLKKPVIVIAVKKKDADAGFHGGYGSIIVEDAKGEYVTFDGNSLHGESLVATYNAGDTIR